MKYSLSIFLLTVLACYPALHAQSPPGLPPWRHTTWLKNDILRPPYLPYTAENNIQPDTADLIIEEATKHLGKAYRYGGKGPKTFDCAGFVRYVYRHFDIDLPGGCRSQYAKGRKISDTKKLQRGDLVFWQGREANGHIGHTGIVADVDTLTGRFRFIHAATSSGVRFSYSDESYYARRYVAACRLIADRTKGENPPPSTATKRKRR